MARISGLTSSPFSAATARSIIWHVQIETDGVDVAVLLAAQQVSGAAKFEIERGDAESRAEGAEFLERGEPARGQRRERNILRNQQVGVGALVRASHAAAQLIQFGKAETVGAIDEDRVGARNVEAVFDDRRGDQNVRLAAHEFEHHGFQFLLIHLAVPDHDARFRHQLVAPDPRANKSIRRGCAPGKLARAGPISSSIARRISDSENGATTV